MERHPRSRRPHAQGVVRHGGSGQGEVHRSHRGCCYDRPGTHPDRRKGVGGSNASSFLMLEAPPICECPAGLTVLTVPEAIAWRAASCVNYFTRTKTIIV